jgi:hypothetical protein
LAANAGYLQSNTIKAANGQTDRQRQTKHHTLAGLHQRHPQSGPAADQGMMLTEGFLGHVIETRIGRAGFERTKKCPI